MSTWQSSSGVTDLKLILEDSRSKLTPHGYLICLQEVSTSAQNGMFKAMRRG